MVIFTPITHSHLPPSLLTTSSQLVSLLLHASYFTLFVCCVCIYFVWRPIIVLFFRFSFRLCVFCVCMWVDAHVSACAAESRETGSRELPHVGAGNQIQVLFTPDPSLQPQFLCLK